MEMKEQEKKSEGKMENVTRKKEEEEEEDNKKQNGKPNKKTAILTIKFL